MSKLGKYEDAMIYFDKVLEIDLNHIDSLYFKGLTLSDLGRDEEDIEYLIGY
jgi:tetratricopeptide (TPR) repeat protein